MNNFKVNSNGLLHWVHFFCLIGKNYPVNNLNYLDLIGSHIFPLL